MLITKGTPTNGRDQDRWIQSFSDRLREVVPRLDGQQCKLFGELAWLSLNEMPPRDAAEVFVRSGMTGVTGF